jgi:integrase
MPRSKSTRTKPAKPSPDYPLYAHNSGKWAKKIRSKLFYFGRWDDPEQALDDYLQVKDDLEAGRDPWTIDPEAFTVADACNHFLESHEARVERNDLSPRTFADYHKSCKLMTELLGRNASVLKLGPEHFRSAINSIASRRNPIGTANEVTRFKTVFKWCVAEGLLDREPKYGPDFRQPKAKSIRAHRAQQPAKAFEQDELLAVIDECGTHLQAMVLLGINCAFSNSDCSAVPIDALDLKSGWVHFARQKTAIDRRIPLWPETVEALQRSLERRPESMCKQTENAFFVRPDGRAWAGPVDPTNHITKHFNGALKRSEVSRPGLSFYSLFHTFETIAGDSKDQVAVDAIMGHVDNSMAAIYRHGIDDQRLVDVVNYVRRWLYPNAVILKLSSTGA